MKAAQDQPGRFNRKAFAQALHGTQFPVKDRPGLLFGVRHGDKGEPERERFSGKIVNGRSQVVETLRPA